MSGSCENTVSEHPLFRPIHNPNQLPFLDNGKKGIRFLLRLFFEFQPMTGKGVCSWTEPAFRCEPVEAMKQGMGSKPEQPNGEDEG